MNNKQMLICALIAVLPGVVSVAEAQQTPAPAAKATAKPAPPTKAELSAITARGRLLAEYDYAAWHGSDALAETKPDTQMIGRYIARKTPEGWVVAFGKLNAERDKFLLAYEAVQGAAKDTFTLTKRDPVLENTDFYLNAARAQETALAAFGKTNRPYNIAVLPAPNEQWYVYLMPAQTKADVYPLGADARFLVSKDGTKIITKRQMHVSVIETPAPKAEDKAAAGFHTAIVDNRPEDSDVFFVLSRKPAVPEYIATKQFVYRVETDGAITFLGTAEEFQRKMKK